MMFDAFCRAHGLIVDGIQVGRWVRVPTVDHPRSDNGAYKYLGDVGWAQNWATMTSPELWRPERDEIRCIDVAKLRADAERIQAKTRQGWLKAAKRAQELISRASRGEHGYLQFKGLQESRGLVIDDETLIVPMRHWRSNELVGAQLIRWLPDERRYEKKMLPGMRAKGAVFRIGPSTTSRWWLVEGYATGLSVDAALTLTRSRCGVMVCFSAGNLVHVAEQMGDAVEGVFADNDESQAGEIAAKRTGFRYVMSDVVGEDANDMHKRVGVFRLAAAIRGVA